MNRKQDFNDILDECLTQVLRGETVEACLAAYPGDRDELEPLLRTALDAREAAVVQPRREFRERAAAEFQAAIREIPEKSPGGWFFWHRRWATALAGVVFVLLAGTGVVAASNNSLPDQPLYGVKLATETVRLTTTRSDIGKTELYIEFTDRRVDEIIAMAGKGNVQEVDKVTERLDSQMIAIAELTASDASMLAWNADQSAPHPMVANPEPPTLGATTTTPMITSATKTTATTTTVPMTTSSTTTPAPATTVPEPPPPVTITNTPPMTLTIPRVSTAPTYEDGEIKAMPPPEAEHAGGSGAAEQAELRELVASSAASNTMALKEELEKAPESVRPALERAIEIADMGYEQALSNLGR
jgi:hypothetical protein